MLLFNWNRNISNQNSIFYMKIPHAHNKIYLVFYLNINLFKLNINLFKLNINLLYLN